MLAFGDGKARQHKNQFTWTPHADHYPALIWPKPESSLVSQEAEVLAKTQWFSCWI